MLDHLQHLQHQLEAIMRGLPVVIDGIKHAISLFGRK